MHGPTCIFWANLTPFSLEMVLLVEPNKLNTTLWAVFTPGLSHGPFP